MNATIHCRSTDDMNPHQALEAYSSSLLMTTDLQTDRRATSHKPRSRSIVSAYRVLRTLADGDVVADRQFVRDSNAKHS